MQEHYMPCVYIVLSKSYVSSLIPKGHPFVVLLNNNDKNLNMLLSAYISSPY